MRPTREEHLAWCKERALAYVDQGNLVDALASFYSDLRKEPEVFQIGQALEFLLAAEGSRCVMADDAAGMRRLIEGTR